MRRLLRSLALLSSQAALACVPSRFAVKSPPCPPFDAVIVPGCPSEPDGRPSRCQIGRAGQGALLYREGWTENLIVSGSDVHTPYVEAEAMAQVMTVLGVPPARIFLERDALHTDENIYYALLLARRARLERLAITSSAGAAGWMCVMMEHWGHPCSAIALDEEALGRFLPRYDDEISALRAPRSRHWEPLEERADRIARTTGHRRPPSWVFYPLYRVLGPSHRPIAPEHPEPITWAERLRELDGPP